jgi:hypothetical protein
MFSLTRLLVDWLPLMLPNLITVLSSPLPVCLRDTYEPVAVAAAESKESASACLCGVSRSSRDTGSTFDLVDNVSAKPGVAFQSPLL